MRESKTLASTRLTPLCTKCGHACRRNRTETFGGKVWKRGSIPMRRRFELNGNSFLVLFNIEPFSKRVPVLRDDLNQDFALWNVRNLHRTVLIRLEIHFSQLLVVQEPSRRVVADVNARVRNGLAVFRRHYDAELGRPGARRLLLVLRSLGRLVLGGRGIRSAGLRERCSCAEGANCQPTDGDSCSIHPAGICYHPHNVFLFSAIRRAPQVSNDLCHTQSLRPPRSTSGDTDSAAALFVTSYGYGLTPKPRRDTSATLERPARR